MVIKMAKKENKTFEQPNNDVEVIDFTDEVSEEKVLEVDDAEKQETETKKNKKKRKAIEIENAIRYLNVSKDEGLNGEIVAKRIEDGLVNVNNIKTTKSYKRIIFGNIFTFFNMLYLIVLIFLIVTQAKITNFIFVIIVVVNTTMSIIQEIKAKRMMERLKLVKSASAHVIREGIELEVAPTEVVLDDVVSFKSGNQIYADSVVLDGSLEVNESMITGEPDAIQKHIGDTIFSGSYVVAGSCFARVDKVGKDNYIEKLAVEAKQQKENKSELLRSMNWIIRIIGFIIVPLFILEFIQLYCGFDMSKFKSFDWQSFKETAVPISGVIIGMIPAGLFLLTTIALSQGVFTLGKKYHTSVQELYCIEMLARVDTLCLDKTGTITDGTMRVVDCIEIKNSTNYSVRDIVGSMMSAFTDTNATSEALIRFFAKNNVLKPSAVLPFSSQRKYSAVTFKDAGTFYLGAPEFVLSDTYVKVKDKVEQYAKAGCRVVAISQSSSAMKKNGVSGSVKPIALIVIQDHIREGASDTIQFFKDNGVDVKVISGDNPITVSDIARRVGIAGYDKYISLEGMSEDEVKEVAMDYTIFGRVTPNQKRALVQAFKKHKRTVAMTGDGVNDILAMKESDCSIAMASGSEAARNVGNIVLMDSNFSSMPRVVAEGRRVINNIQRTSTLFLTKTLLVFFLSIFYLILGLKYSEMKYPFSTSNMVLIELIIIGLSSTVLSLIPNKEKIRGKFIINVLNSSIPGALTVLVLHIVLFYFMHNQITQFVTEENYKTMALIITTAVTLEVLNRMCKPFNWIRMSVYLVAFVVTWGSIILALYASDTVVGKVLNEFLEFTKLESPSVLMLLVGILMIGQILLLSEKITGMFRKIKILE